MAFVRYTDDALVLALSSLRMNNYIINNNDDNNYNNYNYNKISVGTDYRNIACITHRFSNNLHNTYLPSSSASSALSSISQLLSTTEPLVSFSKFNHSRTNHYKSQHDYDDGYTGSVPSLKSLVFNKKDSLLNFPENLVKILNYSDWKMLHEVLVKYADPQIVTTLESWHGMHLIGIDSLMKYFITMVHSKPDLMHSIIEVETIHQSILAKTSWYCTDFFHILEQLHNSNHQNDIIVSNLSCSRILRILPLMNLEDVHSDEVREILDLLESKHDLLLSGETFMHLTIDKYTRKIMKFHIQSQILKIKAIKQLGHS
jgi:hypothetical protein